MSSNLKDKKIEIFKNDPVRTDLGSHEDHYTSRGKFWAYTRLLSMDEYTKFGLDTSEIYRLFIVNYNKEIKPKDHLIYRDQEFNIYMIDTYNDNKQDMKLYTKNVSPQRIR